MVTVINLSHQSNKQNAWFALLWPSTHPPAAILHKTQTKSTQTDLENELRNMNTQLSTNWQWRNIWVTQIETPKNQTINSIRFDSIRFDNYDPTPLPLLILFTSTLQHHHHYHVTNVRTITPKLNTKQNQSNNYLMEKQTNKTKPNQTNLYTDKNIFVSRNAIHWIWMYSLSLYLRRTDSILIRFDFHSIRMCVYVLFLYIYSLFDRLRMASAVKSSRHFPRNVPSRSTFHSGEFSVHLFLLVLIIII